MLTSNIYRRLSRLTRALAQSDRKLLVTCAALLLRPRHGRLRVLPFVSQDDRRRDSHNWEKVLEGCTSEVFPQSPLGTTVQAIPITLSPVGVRQLRAATVMNHSAAVVMDQQIILNDPSLRPHPRANSSGGLLVEHGDKLGLIRSRQSRKLESGFWLGGLGSFNWYHWLLEVLPKILIFEASSHYRSSDKVLLIPQHAMGPSSFRESLDAVAGEWKFVPLDDDTSYLVDTLYVSDPVNWMPFNPRVRSTVAIADCMMRKDITDQLAKKICLASGAHRADNAQGRFFLARTTGRRRYNQDEAIALAREFGFSPVDTGALSLREQIELFSNAEIIVGPTGAAWAGLMFSSPRTRCLIWASRHTSHLAVFSTLAGISGAALSYLHTDEDGSISGGFYDEPYQLDLQQLREALTSVSLT